MATREFDDDRSTGWSLKGGRHNFISRHRGMHGLWYVVGTWGQGRYMSHWSLQVFPDSVRVSGYAGRSYSRIMTEALLSHCLLDISGSGGRDFGKSAMSKGGYRPGGAIAYEYDGEGFDSELLNDGDEFLRQVLEYEPTPDGVREGAARDKLRKEHEADVEKAEKEARNKAWHEKYAAEEKARNEAKATFEAMFADVEIPEEFKHRITHHGLKVYRDRGEGPSWFQYYDQATLTSLEAHQKWLTEAKVKLLEEQEKAEEWAQEKKRREEERRAEEYRIAKDKKYIEGDLCQLDDILSNL